VERRVSIAVRLLAALALAWGSAALAQEPAKQVDQHLVLVAAQESALGVIPADDLRNAYLGSPIESAGTKLRPLLNVTDDVLYQVFLQKVLFMSQRTYERHVLSHVYRLGGTRPPAYADADALLAALHDRPGAVTFMWRPQAENISGIRILADLWSGTVD